MTFHLNTIASLPPISIIPAFSPGPQITSQLLVKFLAIFSRFIGTMLTPFTEKIPSSND